MPKKVVALIDGEHYPPVTKAALEKISETYNLKAAVFIGGSEKISGDNDLSQLGIEVIKENNAENSLVTSIKSYKPDMFIDLSDEPVLDYKKRFYLAAIALKNGVAYKGADFLFTPPELEKILNKPSLAIIGTGKRVGKTAISAYISRLLKKEYDPVIIAMGRGGPKDPDILDGENINLTPEDLLAESLKGKHAASDYYEDALVSGVKTIGCRRAGGGLAGVPFISNVKKGAKIANRMDNDFVILEGSGSTIPPVRADKNILVIGAYQNYEDIAGYFGPYRLMISNLIIITMSEEPHADAGKIAKLEKLIKLVNPDAQIIKTIFRPKPLAGIAGKKVLVATTAKSGLKQIKDHLEKKYGAEIVDTTNQLSNRPMLQKAIEKAPDFDILLTEIKAAAIDIATQAALNLGKKVVFMDNNPIAVDGKNLDTRLLALAKKVYASE